VPLVSVDVGQEQQALIIPIADSVLQYQEYVVASPSGFEVLVISGGNRMAWTNKRLTLHMANGVTKSLTDGDMAVASAQWSPNGDAIVFAAGPDDAEAFGGLRAKHVLAKRRIWFMAADGQQCRQLTADDRYRDESPVWAKDGRHVLFVRMDERNNVSAWSVESADGRLSKLVDDISGFEGKDSWFGFYGRVSWSSMVAFSKNE
jgi:dipeptidyl aminopeptidase/acylaminoacyl peptidase